MNLTPRQIVAELDRHIVGQAEAKRVVAIAIRNRWRRMQLPEDHRRDVSPHNIMLIGPTGVGKTEIARRLATLVAAPFVKVEATRFTEVGYVGRDVESMVRELVETSIAMVKGEAVRRVDKKAADAAEERLLDLLAPRPPSGGEEAAVRQERYEETRRKMREKLVRGELDERVVEITAEERQTPFLQVFSPGGTEEVGFDMPGALGNLFQPKSVTRKLSVKDARAVLAAQEAEKLIDRDRVLREGLQRAQESGILFIDEIDKIVGSRGGGGGPDVSREGVQRDLLPIVEGSTASTRYGPVRTDHVLFIAAGAFSQAKPTDLIPELQGRFPLRAELTALGQDDLARILREPECAMLKQAEALLGTEGVKVSFSDDAVEEMAATAARANATMQDIGARRLHTVVERVLEDLSFTAPDIAPAKVAIDRAFVRKRLEGLLENEDLRRYIL